MRRANGEGAAAGRAGGAFRRAAVALAMGLALAPPAVARAGGSGAIQVGQRVVARTDGIALHDDRGVVVGVGGKGQVYRVERMERRRVWLRNESNSLAGWVATDEVVAAGAPADPAVERAAARTHHGLGAALTAPLRHARYEACLRLAYAAIDKKDLNQAITECTEAIQVDPQRAQAYADRAAIWGMKNEPDMTLADCNEAIRLDPRHARAHVSRGNAWLMKNQVEKALADYNEAIQLDPGEATAYVDRGGIWVRKNDADRAIADLDEAIRLNPRSAMAFNNRGAARLLKGQYDRALDDLSAAIQLDPADPGGYCNRARVWRKKGQYDRALADLNEALRLDPGNAPAQNGLAWMLATCPDARYRDGKRAVASATHACERNGWRYAYDLGTLAASCAEAGDFAAAVKWQAQANPQYTEATDRTEGEARMALYRAGKPYREPRP